MGTITRVDFIERRAAATLSGAELDALADQVAAWRFSPVVRFILAAATFGVILVGLAMIVGAAAIVARTHL